jgi:hypothetical protein
MKTFEYPMRATCLTKADWTKVMAPLLKAVLPQSGFSQSFPRAVLYGPTEFQGMGMMDPWILQELKHLEALWDKTTHMDASGYLLSQKFESLRMELGTPDALTDHNYHLFEYCTTDSWLKTLWKSCQQFQIKFDDPFFKPKLQRTGDTFLMHAFALQYSSKQLAILNQCRMFLKAITLADITTVDGTQIHPWSYAGITREPHLHRYNWPRQPRSLPATHWNLWKLALAECFSTNYSNAGSLSVQDPLGDWLVDPLPMWPWMHNTTTNKLYHREGLLYQEYTPLAQRATRQGNYSRNIRNNWKHPDPNQRPVGELPPGTYRVVDVFFRRD